MSDAELRIFIYDTLVATGRAPSSMDIARRFATTPGDARAHLAALRIGKTVLIHVQTGEVWMAGPFAATHSNYRLTDGDTTWFANCAWDMFGVANIVGRTLRAAMTCEDCGEAVEVECNPDAPPPPSGDIVHFLLPAREWYADIGFT